jgi:putative SOS response-associated peptidase YedK
VVGLQRDGTRGMIGVQWGFVPSDSNDSKPKFAPINARSETVDRLPMFREAFRYDRCLVPADGFYEWAQVTAKKKQPYHFRMKDGEPFAFAGIWAIWTDGKTGLRSCCILTTEPNDLVRTVHDRMPLILPRERYAKWLSRETSVAELLTLLKPYAADEMEMARANPIVGSVKNDGPECLEPDREPEGTGSLFGSLPVA